VIAPQELLEIKQRLLVGADAARRIAGSGDEFVMYEQEQYEIVVSALLGMKNDVGRVLAELDILRGMFSEKLAGFFHVASTGGIADAGDSRVDVAAVPVAEDQRRGEEVRPNDAGSGSGVPPERPVRRRGRRPKPVSDQGGVPADTGKLG
jgi:hypothetical protein